MDKEGQFITHYKMEVIIAYEGQQQLQYKAPIVILVLTPNFAHEHFITCTIKVVEGLLQKSEGAFLWEFCSVLGLLGPA